jgi:uncharacterized phiE125 gp8 family phage protein
MICGNRHHQNALQYHSLRRLAEPEVEPVSLFDMKDHLRVMPDQAEDDAYIQGLIAAGRRFIESRLGSCTTATRWTARLERLGCESCCSAGVAIPMPPLLLDDEHPFEAVLRDGDGGKTTIERGAYAIDDDVFPAVLRRRRGWPNVCCESSVSVKFWAGYRTAEEVPAQIRAALKLLVGHWYENRESVATDSGAIVMPHAVDALLASESWNGRF